MRCSREPELEALLAAELGEASRIDLESHVTSCPSCAAALRQLRAVRGLLQVLPEVEPSELEWRRIDKRVIERMGAARATRAPWTLGALAAGGMALAAGLAMVIATRPLVHPFVAPVASLPEVVVRVPAVALALGGQAHTTHAPQILEGDELRTTEGSLEVQTAPATGIALAAHSLATATRLRAGETELALAQGQLLAEVKPLQRGQSFEVHAGDLVVHVVGTAFLVERLGNTVRVAVVHGRVRVDRPGQPGSFEVGGGSEATVADGQDLATVHEVPMAAELPSRFPLGFPDVPPEVVASQYRETNIDSSPEGARALVDGADRGQTPLSLLAPEGEHEVALALPGHALGHAHVRVSGVTNAAQVQLAPEADVAPPAPVPVPMPTPAPVRSTKRAPPPTAAAEVVAAPAEPAAPRPLPTFLQAFATASAAYQPDVQRCYAEQGGLYPRPVHLKVAVQPNGRVSPPIATDDVGLSAEFLDCVTKAANQWSFPVSGLSYDTTLPFQVEPAP